MSMEEGVDSWSIDIRRETITYNTDIEAVEEWFVVFNMHHGLGMFTTKGTLLDIMREPILQWSQNLGPIVDVTKNIRKIQKLIVSKSPCAGDVAVIGVVYDQTVSAIVIGITKDGFMSRETTWYDLTANLCTLLDKACINIALVNIILTNARLRILTSLGLFISYDLRYPTGKNLQFSRPNLCGFEMDDYLKSNIWYNRQCLANREPFEADFVALTFDKDKSLSQESPCLFSNDATLSWSACLPPPAPNEKRISRRALSFLVDYEENTGILMLFQEVWISFDGGNSFLPLMKLVNEAVVIIDFCVYTQAIIFVTDKRNLYYTKAGSLTYTKLKNLPLGVFTSYFDHLGNLYDIRLNATSKDGLMVSSLDVKAFMKEKDLGFEGFLVPEILTEQEMIIYHYSKPPHKESFTRTHVGKKITFE